MADTIDLPDILPYPTIKPIDDMPELHGRFVYVIESYPETGLSIVISRQIEHVFVRIGDFAGNLIDPTKQTDVISKIGDDVISYLMEMTKLIGIDQAQYYLSEDEGELRLVDLRLSLNKFSGPGYINDFFSKKMNTQKIVKVDMLTEDYYKALLEKDKEFIIKPSAFKLTTRGDEAFPMYGRISNEA